MGKKIKIIIPADFEQELMNPETDLVVQKRQDYQATETDYQMDPSDLNNVIMGALAILAVPGSIEGIFNLIERIKSYLKDKKNSSRKIVIQTPEHKYFFYGTTSEETYKEIKEYFEKLKKDGKLDR